MTTNDRGQFETTVGIDIANVVWAISATGFTPSGITWSSGNEGKVEVTMDYCTSIEGRLVESGRPVAGARIGLVNKVRDRVQFQISQQTTTDENGVFRFSELAKGEQHQLYTLHNQEITGVLPVTQFIAAGGGQLLQFGDIETEPPQTLTISVLTLDGGPLPADANVHVARREAFHESKLPLRTNDAGEASVSLSGIGREMVEVVVSATGYEPIRTFPNLPKDRHQKYRLFTDEQTKLTVVLQQQTTKSLE